MHTARSTDGTAISYETCGQGPPLILVDGALCYREMGPSRALAEALCEDFTVISYDRRGRGASTDTGPYSVEREIDDLAALIAAAGGSSAVRALRSSTTARGCSRTCSQTPSTASSTGRRMVKAKALAPALIDYLVGRRAANTERAERLVVDSLGNATA